ncbi:hypothetical protein KJ682_08910 [bacterium]|nr:hypothetical protein [bacterium]
MSTRQILNLAQGAVVIVLTASLVIAFSQGRYEQDTVTQIDLAQRQQMIIQDLSRQVDALATADEFEAVAQARREVGRTVLQFDQNLAALLQGGLTTGPDGAQLAVARTGNRAARAALEEAANLWRATGAPLADLAAGEYSVFSAAGRNAVQELADNNILLMQQMGMTANALRDGAAARRAMARAAAFGAGFAVLILGALVWLRVRDARKAAAPAANRPAQDPEDAPRKVAGALAASLTPPGSPTRSREERRAAENRKRPETLFAAPVDFDSVNASVDQMSVDMNTIASSTDKMRQAIDSVGHALQGMLYSLNEMAQDTAEGYKIVRGANNAASFTADAAFELVESAREMSRVVARVTQLATKTRHVAGQIDAEAVVTGQTGAAFTSVVASEVKGLSRQTSQATEEIEATVSDILQTARQYEEAIGQIIKNISAINKVSQHLGELMISPPPRVIPGAPPAPSPALRPEPPKAAPAPAEPPVAEPPAGAPDPFQHPVQAADPEPEPEAIGSDAPAPAAEAPRAPEPEPAPAPPARKPAFSLGDDEPSQPEPTLEELAEETTNAIAEASQSPAEPEIKTAGSNANVFILGKPKAAAKPVAQPQAQRPAAEVENPAPTHPAPAEAPKSPPPPAAEKETPSGSNGNVFLLNRPKKSPAETKPPAGPEAVQAPPSAPAAPAAPAAETCSPAPERPNIYNLKMPGVARPAGESRAEPAAEAQEPPVETPAPETESPAAESKTEKPAGDKPNVFILTKPK